MGDAPAAAMPVVMSGFDGRTLQPRGAADRPPRPGG